MKKILLALSIVLISSMAYCKEEEIIPDAAFIKNICTDIEESDEKEIKETFGIGFYKKQKKANAIRNLYYKINGYNKIIKQRGSQDTGTGIIMVEAHKFNKIDKEFIDYMKNTASPIINKDALHYNIQFTFAEIILADLLPALKFTYGGAGFGANNDNIFIVKDKTGKKIVSNEINILENYEALYDLFSGYIKKIDPNFKFTGSCAK